jgi:hypothetical protein
VRQAFRDLGHDAWSCDLLPAEDGSPFHWQCDVRDVINFGWDLMIAFPPCTYLCSSGMHWTVRGLRDPKLTEDAIEFVRMLMDAPIDHIGMENPVGCISTRIRKPDQIIHPWQFGHPESKTTCLWLKNLPLLKPTEILKKNGVWANQTPSGQNKLGPSERRWAERSKTYEGIARAMSAQWSGCLSYSPQTFPNANAVESRGAQLTLNIFQTVPA